MGGLVKEALVVRSDGRVELDGKPIGWIGQVQLDSLYKFDAGRRAGGAEEYLLRFEVHVVPEKPEPDAVYDMAGRVIGYQQPDGSVKRVDSVEDRAQAVWKDSVIAQRD